MVDLHVFVAGKVLIYMLIFPFPTDPGAANPPDSHYGNSSITYSSGRPGAIGDSSRIVRNRKVAVLFNLLIHFCANSLWFHIFY